MRGWTRLKADTLGSGAAWKARQHWWTDFRKDNHPFQNTQSRHGKRDLLMLSHRHTDRHPAGKESKKCWWWFSPLGEATLSAAGAKLLLALEEPEGRKSCLSPGLPRAPAPLKLSQQSQLCEESSRYNEIITQFVLKNILHFNKKRLYVRKSSFTNLEVFLPASGVRMS